MSFLTSKKKTGKKIKNGCLKIYGGNHIAVTLFYCFKLSVRGNGFRYNTVHQKQKISV